MSAVPRGRAGAPGQGRGQGQGGGAKEGADPAWCPQPREVATCALGAAAPPSPSRAFGPAALSGGCGPGAIVPVCGGGRLPAAGGAAAPSPPAGRCGWAGGVGVSGVGRRGWRGAAACGPWRSWRREPLPFGHESCDAGSFGPVLPHYFSRTKWCAQYKDIKALTNRFAPVFFNVFLSFTT